MAADRALTQLLADLAPLQPGGDRAALAGLGQFDQALQQVAISLQQQARTRLATAKETQLLTTSYRAISLMLEQLAQEWQRNGQFAEETQSELLTLLVQQQPRNLLTVTGVTTFSDGNDPLLEQEPDDYPGQDASWNRTRPQLAYRKLDDLGQVLPDNAPSWQCVKDLNTGLVWEVKSDDPLSPARKSRPFAYEDEQFKATAGEQQAAYQHIHNRIEQLTAEGDLSALARAQALTTMLTTRAYQQWLNGEQRCGISQWRLPTMGELMSLMHYGSSPRTRWVSASSWIPVTSRISPPRKMTPTMATTGAPPATPPSASPVAPSANAQSCSWEKMRAPPIPRWCSKIPISS